MALFWLLVFGIHLVRAMEDCPFYSCDKYLSTSLVCANKDMGHIKACNYTSKYTKFKDIVLKKSNITSLDPELFSQMNKLASLYLSDNPLDTLDYRLFRKLKSLTYLDLKNNRLTFLDDRIFKNQKHLHTLLLEGNQLTSLRVEVLLPLEYLTYLNLKNNRLTFLDDRIFKNQKHLHTLFLEGNQLTSLRVEVLLPLESLKTLSLIRNPFSCNCDFVKITSWCEIKGLSTNVSCINEDSLIWPRIYETCTDTKLTDITIIIILCVSLGALFCVVATVVIVMYWKTTFKFNGKDKNIEAKEKISPLLLPKGIKNTK